MFSLDADVAPFTVILTAFSILLHKYTREVRVFLLGGCRWLTLSMLFLSQEDVVVGSSSQNYNPLILRLPRISGTESFMQLLNLTRAVEESAAKYEVPYQELYTRLRPITEDGPSGPLFQARGDLMKTYSNKIYKYK